MIRSSVPPAPDRIRIIQTVLVPDVHKKQVTIIRTITK
jgi:hypothetical protein